MASSLVDENRHFQVFEEMERNEGTDVAKVKNRLQLEREEDIGFSAALRAVAFSGDVQRAADALVMAKGRDEAIIDAQLKLNTIHEMNQYSRESGEIASESTTASSRLRSELDLPLTRCGYVF